MVRRNGRRRGRAPLLSCLLLASTLGCQSLLPSDDTRESEFKSFDEARDAFEAIVPGETTRDELRELGIDPWKRGTFAHAYTSITQYFFPHRGITPEFVDPAILACLEARTRCEVWGIDATRDKGNRETWIVLDWLDIHVRKRRTGYDFEGLVLVQDDVATYAIYRGRPRYRALEERIRPLGPLQDGPAVKIRPLQAEPHAMIIGGGDSDVPTLTLPNPIADQILSIFQEEKLADEAPSGATLTITPGDTN